VHPDGSVVLLPKVPAVAAKRPITIEEMDAAAAAGAAAHTLRGKRR